MAVIELRTQPNAVINCGCTLVVKNGGLHSVNFITLLSEVFEVIDIKSRLLDALDNNEQTSDQRHTLFYDACEKISTLEHENKKMRECIDGIIFSYRFMTGFGENEGFLQDGFRERLVNANKLINGE